MLPALRSWGVETSPFDVLLDLRRGLNSTAHYGRTLPAEIVETEDALRLSIEMPGVSPDEVDVTVENRVLTVSGEIGEGEPPEGYRRWLSERSFGSFQRSFVLPEYVQADEVEAHFENGVLHLTLPKAEEPRPRRIEIGSGGRKRLFPGKEA